MTKLKVLATALFATAVISAPVMARDYHHRHRVFINSAAAAPGAVYVNGRACIPAPRVGAFATAPWSDTDIPCEPNGYGYGARYDSNGY